MKEKDYFLGYSEKELQRLEHQHSVILDFSLAALNEAFPHIDPNKSYNILEIGSGVGLMIPVLATHFQLQSNKNSKLFSIEPGSSSVLAIEQRIKKVCPEVESQIKIFNLDIQGAFKQNVIAPNSLDCVYTRLCLLYVPDLENVLSILTTWLKPGGKFIFEEADSVFMNAKPSHPLFEKGWRVFQQTLEKTGAYATKIGPMISKVLNTQGKVTVESVQPWIKEGKPGSDVWNWLRMLFFTVTSNAQKQGGDWTDEDTEKAIELFEKMEESPNDYIVSSPQHCTYIASLIR